MKKTEKQLLLQELINKVESHLFIAVNDFQNRTEQRLAESRDGWSAAQCLAHLNTYGDYYLPKIKNIVNSSSEDVADDFYVVSC